MAIQEIDWSTFTFRCSSLGYIMTEPKSKTNFQKWDEANTAHVAAKKSYFELTDKEQQMYKGQQLLKKCTTLKEKVEKLAPLKDTPTLSDTCMTHLCDIYTVVTSGRTEDIKSKYMEKGTKIEEQIITNYSLLFNKFHKKNNVRRKNHWVEGEMDFEDEDMILDAKGNWTIFQFNRVKSKPIKPLYQWQLDGYMWLWNKQRGRLVYGLVNTPEKLIKAEKSRLVYDFIGSEEDYEAACKEIDFLHTYDDIPLNLKIRLFDVERDEERIERIKKRVEECRWFLSNFDNNETNIQEDEEDDN